MSIIDSKTPGLVPITDHRLQGLVVAIRPISKRLSAAKLQLATVNGGFGADPDKIGSSVFLDPLWVEWPPGSGTLVRQGPGLSEDGHGIRASRGTLLGLASDELVRRVSEEPDAIEPADPDDLCIIVVGTGVYGLGDTVREAMKAAGVKGLAGTAVGVCHRESYVNDYGFIVTPRYAIKAGRPQFQWVHGGPDKLSVNAAAAQAHAERLIAAGRN